jgi:predicted small lipoprotein YifL
MQVQPVIQELPEILAILGRMELVGLEELLARQVIPGLKELLEILEQMVTVALVEPPAAQVIQELQVILAIPEQTVLVVLAALVEQLAPPGPKGSMEMPAEEEEAAEEAGVMVHLPAPVTLVTKEHKALTGPSPTPERMAAVVPGVPVDSLAVSLLREEARKDPLAMLVLQELQEM